MAKIRADIKDGAPENVRKQSQEIDDYFVQNSGLFNTHLPEANPVYNRTPSEKVIQAANNQFIIMGRDRPRGADSGYGGRGNTHAGCIDIIAGMSGMMCREVNSDEQTVYTDKSPELDAARIYISQRTDIDDNFHLTPGRVGSPKTRSGIAIKADGVRIIARDGIKLVTGTDTYNSQGVKVNIRSGIDLIAGNEDTTLQPLVKGENMVKAMAAQTDLVMQLNGLCLTLVKSYIQLLLNLAVHVHVSTAPGTPVSPSPDLATGILSQVSTLVTMITDLQANQMNSVMLKGNYLFPAGESYINSTYNTTN